jgi:hypothetical protein
LLPAGAGEQFSDFRRAGKLCFQRHKLLDSLLERSQEDRATSLAETVLELAFAVPGGDLALNFLD